MNEQREVMDADKAPEPESQAGEEGKTAAAKLEILPKPLDKMNKAELLEKIKELQSLSDKNYDLYLRSQAEMENMKKRHKKEKEDWVKFSNESLIGEILPVVDSFESALSHTDNEDALQALKQGVELTLKGLKAALRKSGLEEIKAEGEPFDPCFHEAVSQVEDEKAEAGRVVHEVKKGYLLNKRLIRPAMVVVNKGKPPAVSYAEYSEVACEKS